MKEIDSLNDKAYSFHYKSLDSTVCYAKKALENSSNYDSGKNEALNNLAFVDIMKMNYSIAMNRLTGIIKSDDNQIELLVANIQMMRLCQRQSRNKEFYDYYWKANQNLNRINEERSSLTDREKRRVTYSETEMKIVLSAYLFYVGQIRSSIDVVKDIDENGEIQKDTAQLLNLFYNIGSGEYFVKGSLLERKKTELDYLIRCFFIAQRGGYVFWQANALQAMSEHLQDRNTYKELIATYDSAIKALNIDNVDDSLLAGNFAQRSLNDFILYGDPYQIAGAHRTLSDCYFQIGDYLSAVDNLNNSIVNNAVIDQAPALKASIYEKLSINHSALNDKPNSDYYRNLYLITQENTRQDRELEARAEQLDVVSFQLNIMIICVFIAIALLFILLIIFTKKRKKKEEQYTSESFLTPLENWKSKEILVTDNFQKRHDEIIEEQKVVEFSLEQNLHKNIEQRAKMSLVNSIIPFIDRMLAEIDCLQTRHEDENRIRERYKYILELTDKINEYNLVLTNWIELRKGELNLHIESFKLQELFDIISRGRATFNMKNISLEVTDTSAVVKADKVLTLFMLNTLADNARKAIGADGTIGISADDNDNYVEISISDNGAGMNDTELENVFNHQPSAQKQHGFGLMNCKGIIEKYKKISKVFSICQISAESKKGEGTVFKFRLPHGICRILIGITMLMSPSVMSAEVDDAREIKMYADSAYFCNLQGKYGNTIAFAKLTCIYINRYYRKLYPNGKDTIRINGGSIEQAAELVWFRDSLPMKYNIILDMRNETAVAALALHDWDLYNYNNGIYTRLFRETSADNSLPKYVRHTQIIRNTKNVAIIILILLLLCIIPAYYILYYRYKVYYQSLIDSVKRINLILFENTDENSKLQKITELWQKSRNIKYSATKETSALNDVVLQIIDALEKNIEIKKQDADEVEFAEDELQKLNFENQRLYINNNVLDNCFSTLKHETMYYPSRIKQIITESECNLNQLEEVTRYYKDLFEILSMQAQSQVEGNIRISNRLLSYLNTILEKLSENNPLIIRQEKMGEFYDLYIVECRNLRLSQEQIENLFTPQTSNLQCLLIRQIVREIGETTSKRGCGVQARRRDDGETEILITLSSKINLMN